MMSFTGVRRSSLRAFAGAAAAALALGLAACGGDDEAETGGGGSAAQEENGGSQKLADFEAALEKDLETAAADQTARPDTAGPKAAPGKKVHVIACILAAEGCARESRTAMEAGKAIGWDMKLVDTGSVPAKMASAVQSAIDAKVDGIIVQAIDAKFMLAPLKKAKDAGIKIVSFAATNQDDVYDHQVPAERDFFDHGYRLGQQMYKDTDGKPRLLFMYDQSFGVTSIRKEGTEKFFADCKAAGGDCEIVDTANFLVTELTTRVPGLAGQAMRRNRDVNAIWMSYDSAQPFINQGLRQAGIKPDQVGLYGFDGNTHNLEAIRKGDYQKATMAGPFEWIGWEQVDALNRMLQDQEPAQDVIQMKLMTKDNVPETNKWQGDVDFRPIYKEIWGK